MRSRIFYLFLFLYPIGSMYGIFTYIYHKNQPNVGKYTSPMDPMGYWFWTVDQYCTALALMILMDKIHCGWINGWKIHTDSRLESTYVEMSPLSNFSKKRQWGWRLGGTNSWVNPDIDMICSKNYHPAGSKVTWFRFGGFYRPQTSPNPKSTPFDGKRFGCFLHKSWSCHSRSSHYTLVDIFNQTNLIDLEMSSNMLLVRTHFISAIFSVMITLWANYTKVTRLKNRDSDIRTFQGSQTS